MIKNETLLNWMILAFIGLNLLPTSHSFAQQGKQQISVLVNGSSSHSQQNGIENEHIISDFQANDHVNDLPSSAVPPPSYTVNSTSDRYFKIDGQGMLSGNSQSSCTSPEFWAPGGTYPNLPTASWGGASAWLGDTLYAHTPNSSGEARNTMLKYTFNGNWIEGNNLPGPKSGMALVAAAGKLYAIGGGNSGVTSGSNEVLSYDPSTGEWSILASLPAILSAHSAVVWGDSVIFVVGGPWVGSASNLNVHYYRIATNTWGTIVNSLPSGQGRRTFGLGLVDNKIIVSCGFNTNFLKSTLVGTIGANASIISWQTAPAPPLPAEVTGLSRLGATSHGDLFYIVGGERGSLTGRSDKTYIFKPSENAWVGVIDDMPYARSNIFNNVTSKCINDNVILFVVGGTGNVSTTGFNDPTDRFEVTTGGAAGLSVSTQAVSAITANAATGNGNITSIGSGNANNRGVIYYPYTNTNKEISGVDVSNVSENGSFGTGAFTTSLTGLTVNTRYNVRAHATNDDGTKYGDRVDFWTLANVPSAPTVNNPTTTTLDVAVNANGNPTSTEFAIRETTENKFVQANGTLGASAAWQTATAWGTKTVTALTTGVEYTFEVKARNGNNIETAYGATASLQTSSNSCTNPTDGGVIAASQNICSGSSPSAFTSTSLPSGHSGTLEYKWQSTTSDPADPGFDPNSWVDIASSNTATYQAGALTQTTWFRRLARVSCEADWSGAAASNTLQITVRPQFTAGAIATTGQTICYSADPSVIGSTTAASGGDNVIEYKWQSSPDGTTWTDIASSNAATYDPSNLTATTHYQRLAKDGTCNAFTASTGVWIVTVRPQFTAGAIATTGQTICYNTDPSVIGSTTAASGGDNVIEYKWQSSPDGTTWTDIASSNAATYDPSNLTATTHYQRLAKDGTCNAFTASTGVWIVTVRPQFTAGAIATTGQAICYEGTPSVIGSLIDASGGDQTITYSWRSSADNYAAAISGAIAASFTPPAGLTSTTTYRRYAKDGTCNTTPEQASGEWTVTVEPIALAGNFISSPLAFTTLCEGTPASALLTNNTGGNGIDQTEYRVWIGTSYSAWMPYNGELLSIPGALFIEIRSRRLASYCSPSDWIYSGWSFELTPQSGSLTRHPDVNKVCEGTPVWADLSNADGGNGSDERQYRKQTGSSWSSWMPYDGMPLSTVGSTAIEIRSRRLADFCSHASFVTVGWNVESTPMAGSLIASPSQNVICETASVSASLIAGSGGSGHDITEFRTHNGNSWSSWMTYNPGSPIAAAGLSHVEIRTFRQGDVCSNSGYNTVSWNIEKQAQSGILVKLPASNMVCEGSVVNATLIPGSGGNGTDELHYRTRNGNTWSLWHTYTSASPISTSGFAEVEIRTRRMASFCLPSDEQVVTWMTEPVPFAFAGNNASVCANSSFQLSAAQASNANGLLWTSSGDGSFSNATLLNPSYTPGNTDKVNGWVTLTLTANTNGLCQVQSVMQLSFNNPVTPSVSIVANQMTVCEGTPVQFTATTVNAGNNPVLTWKVNEVIMASHDHVFNYIPNANDVVSAEMLSDHPCVLQPLAMSNAVMVNVISITLEVQAVPANSGTASFTGNLQLGSIVTLSASAFPGYVFIGWTNQAGQLIGNSMELQVTIDGCYTLYYANFSSNASLSGYLKYFNPIESTIAINNSYFKAQLFSQNIPIGMPTSFSSSGFLHFDAINPGQNYTLRIWEQAPGNLLSNAWIYNNWGGVSAVDALIASYMAVNMPFQNIFPWIQPAENAPYSNFALQIADVNASGNVTGSDALTMMFRIVEGNNMPVFPNNRHNFIVSGSRVSNPNALRYPQAPELVFQPFGSFEAASPSHSVFYEVNPGAIQSGSNYLNIYLSAAGDLNASFVPGMQQKTSASLIYSQLIEAKEGEVVVLPVYADSDLMLGAITLGLKYNTDFMEVMEVEGFDVNSIDRDKGIITIAWNDINGKSFTTEKPMLTLKVLLKQQINASTRFMELMPITEFASSDAKVIEGVQLRTPAISSHTTAASNAAITHQLVPNPFKEQARLSFTLPADGKVTILIYNQFGQMVKKLSDSPLKAGYHALQILSADLHQSGTYYYTILHETATKSSTTHGKMILVR